MFDIGWSEMLIIVVAVVLLVGPKELPGVMRQIAIFVRRLGAVKTSILEQVHGFIEDEDGHGKVELLPSLSDSQTTISLSQVKTSDEFEKTNKQPNKSY